MVDKTLKIGDELKFSRMVNISWSTSDSRL